VGATYDPASFYGHSEYDFGIVRMFGGFPKEFEIAYFEESPKKKLFEKRNKLYQLFHNLNHWNHFGSGYRSSSLRIMIELNAEKF
jgi:protein-ribulosamine 3-kinase